MATAGKDRKRARPRYDALVEVSTRLFGEHGFEGTTVRMIADELGVQSGSLYSHIKSKDEVLHLIVMTVADAFFEAVREASEATGNPEEKLRAMCRAHLEVIDDHGLAVRVYYDEWHRLSPKARKQIATLRNSYRNRFTAVVEEGIAEGTFGSVDVPWAVLVILSACNWAVEWYSHEGPRNPAQIADKFMDVIIDGIRAGSPAKPPRAAAPKKPKAAPKAGKRRKAVS
ncbi:MAG: TetR family transcriptional regulator [Actinobacteria bacterium]|nr:TetR family transcriptional regulator [Actinomycetota bacterium]